MLLRCAADPVVPQWKLLEQVLWQQIVLFYPKMFLLHTCSLQVCQRFGLCMRTWGFPFETLHPCISPYFLATVVTLVCPLNPQLNKSAVFSLDFKYPTGTNSKRTRRSFRRNPSLLLSIFFPQVSACCHLLSSVFRWLFIIVISALVR